MPTVYDLVLVAVLVIVAPVVDYAFFWPASRRRMQSDPDRARRRIWASAIVQPWAAVAVVATFWTATGRSWAGLGFSAPSGWAMWAAIGLCLILVGYFAWAVLAVSRSSEAMASLRQQLEPMAELMPHTRAELSWFGGLSVTAGFCEEFLYRGYVIWTLSPWLGWWGAAALSLLLFAAGHAYQGANGVLKTGIFGGGYTLSVAVFNSLWPAITLHALWDFGAGVLSWLGLRESGTFDRRP